MRAGEVTVTDTRVLLGFQSSLVVPIRFGDGRQVEIGVAYLHSQSMPMRRGHLGEPPRFRHLLILGGFSFEL
jgi:hypothetical protein